MYRPRYEALLRAQEPEVPMPFPSDKTWGGQSVDPRSTLFSPKARFDLGAGEIVDEWMAERILQLSHPDRYAALKQLEKEGYEVYASDYARAQRGRGPEQQTPTLQALLGGGLAGMAGGSAGTAAGAAIGSLLGPGGTLAGGGLGFLLGNVLSRAAANWAVPEAAGSDLTADLLLSYAGGKAIPPLARGLSKYPLKLTGKLVPELEEAAQKGGAKVGAFMRKTAPATQLNKARGLKLAAQPGQRAAKASERLLLPAQVPVPEAEAAVADALARPPRPLQLGPGELVPTAPPPARGGGNWQDEILDYIQQTRPISGAPNRSLTPAESNTLMRAWLKDQFDLDPEGAARMLTEETGALGAGVPGTVDAYRSLKSPLQLALELGQQAKKGKFPKVSAPAKGAQLDLGLSEALDAMGKMPRSGKGFRGTMWYHGNKADFPKEIAPEGMFGPGFHLGTRRAAEERIAGRLLPKYLLDWEDLGPGGLDTTALQEELNALGKVHQVRLNPKNPYNAWSQPQWSDEHLMEFFGALRLEQLRKKGYDVLFYQNTVESPNSISAIVLDPKAVEYSKTIKPRFPGMEWVRKQQEMLKPKKTIGDIGVKAQLWGMNPKHTRQAALLGMNTVAGYRKLKKVVDDMEREGEPMTITEALRRAVTTGWNPFQE